MALFNKARGQSSVEVIIGLGLLVIFMGASFTILAVNSTQGMSSEFRAQALNVAEEGKEAVRQIRERDWTLMTPGTHGLALNGATWNFSGTSDVTDGKYTRTVTLATVDSDTIDVTVAVNWTVSGTHTASLSVMSRFTDFRTFETWGDWGTPVIVGSIDLGPQAKATGVAYANDYIFVTAESSSGNRPSFFSIDVIPPTAPIIAADITTQDNMHGAVILEGANKVYTAGETAGSQLRVIDVTNPTSPYIMTSVGANGTIHGITLEGSKLYAGDDTGLGIYDISNPTTPTLITHLGLGAVVYGVAVRDGYVYVSTSHDSQEFMVVNATVPASPTVIWTYDAPSSKDGLSVSLRGTRVYFGTASNSSGSELFTFNRFNPASPSLLDSQDVSGDLNDIKAAGNWVYLATSLANQEFSVYRLNANGIPVYNTGLNLSQVATGIDFFNNTLYVTLRSNDAVQILQPTL